MKKKDVEESFEAGAHQLLFEVMFVPEEEIQ